MTTTLKLDHSFEGDREITRAFRRLERAGGNTEALFIDFGEYMLLTIEERFERQVDPDGRPWAPLHPGTLAKKRNPRILTERGHLRGSYIYRAGADQLEVGTNVIYAAIHQFGGKTRPHTIRPKNGKALFWAGASHPVKVVQHPGSNIPARPVLGINDTDRAEFLDMIHDHYNVIRGL